MCKLMWTCKQCTKAAANRAKIGVAQVKTQEDREWGSLCERFLRFKSFYALPCTLLICKMFGKAMENASLLWLDRPRPLWSCNAIATAPRDRRRPQIIYIYIYDMI